MNLRVGRLPLALGLRGHLRVATRRTVVGSALEDGEMADFRGDFGDELHCGRTGSNHRDALPRKVDVFLWPAGGMKRFPRKALYALKRWGIASRQEADGRDEKLRLGAPAACQLDLPALCFLVVDRRLDSRIELDVFAQVEFVRHIVEIFFVLRLAGIMLLPIPLLQQFFRPRIAVGLALGIEAAAGVAIPIPRAAHAVSILIAAYREPKLPQAVELIQAGHPGTDDNRVIVLNRLSPVCWR